MKISQNWNVFPWLHPANADRFLLVILWTPQNYTETKCSTICFVTKTYQGFSTSSRTNQQNRIAFSILCTPFDKIQQLPGDKYGWKSLGSSWFLWNNFKIFIVLWLCFTSYNHFNLPLPSKTPVSNLDVRLRFEILCLITFFRFGLFLPYMYPTQPLLSQTYCNPLWNPY